MSARHPTDTLPDPADFNEPRAGEVRTVGGAERVVLSPLPLPALLSRTPLGPQPTIVAQNDAYMDLGNSNHGIVFAIQMILIVDVIVATVLAFGFALMANIEMQRPGATGGFWHNYYRVIVMHEPSLPMPFSVLMAVGLIVMTTIMLSAVIKGAFDARRERPLRFHRQRREVCYFPTGSDTPIIVPWESIQAWVERGVMTTGSALLRSIDFCMVIPDPDGKQVWLYRIPMGVMSQALLFWEAIRRYMDEPKDCWATDGCEPESVATFAASRRALLADFANQPRKRWFALSLADLSISYLSIFFYYLYHIASGWNLPFWVAQWYQKFVHGRPMPAQIAEWSAPLPPEQWAKPSDELRRQNAAIYAHYQRGGSLTDFLASQQK